MRNLGEELKNRDPGSIAPVEVEYATVDDRGSRAALIWMNRPDSLNAMSWEMVLELERMLKLVEQDDQVCVVLPRGDHRSRGGVRRGLDGAHLRQLLAWLGEVGDRLDELVAPTGAAAPA